MGFDLAGYLIFAFVTSITQGFGDYILKLLKSEKANKYLGYTMFILGLALM